MTWYHLDWREILTIQHRDQGKRVIARRLEKPPLFLSILVLPRMIGQFPVVEFSEPRVLSDQGLHGCPFGWLLGKSRHEGKETRTTRDQDTTNEFDPARREPSRSVEEVQMLSRIDTLHDLGHDEQSLQS